MSDDTQFTDLEPPGHSEEAKQLKALIIQEFAAMPEDLKEHVLKTWRMMKLTIPPRVYKN